MIGPNVVSYDEMRRGLASDKLTQKYGFPVSRRRTYHGNREGHDLAQAREQTLPHDRLKCGRRV